MLRGQANQNTHTHTHTPRGCVTYTPLPRKSCIFRPKGQYSTPRTPSTTTRTIALIRLLLGELTSLSFVNRVFCTQEGRKKVHTSGCVLIFDVSHTPLPVTRAVRLGSLLPLALSVVVDRKRVETGRKRTRQREAGWLVARELAGRGGGAGARWGRARSGRPPPWGLRHRRCRWWTDSEPGPTP